MMARFRARLAELMRGSAVASAFILVLVSLPVAWLTTYGVKTVSPLALLDRAVRNWEIAIATGAEPQDPDIVIVTMDQDWADQFRYRDPLDRGAVRDLIGTIAAKHPKVIGLDLVLDQQTESEKDDALRVALHELSNSSLIVSAERRDEDDDQQGQLDSFLRPASRAITDFVIDTNTGEVTGAWLSAPTAQGPVWSFPQALACYAQNQAVGGTGRCQRSGSAEAQQEIAWHGLAEDADTVFPEYPAEYVRLLPDSWFTGKIVLVGTDLPGIDRQRTPFTSLLQGRDDGEADVVVQAHALSQLLRGRGPPSATWTLDFLVTLLLALLGALNGTASTPLGMRAVLGIVTLVLVWMAGLLWFYAGGNLIGLVAPTLAAVLAFTAMDALTGGMARRERAAIKRAFESYVPPGLVESVMKKRQGEALGGELRTMTFLFTDVKDFTAMVEGIKDTPARLPPILNAYLDGIAQIVVAHGGMIDKFIGDAVFAIFNAADLEDFAQQAIRCALAIDLFAEEFRTRPDAAAIGFSITRVGVHTGEAIIGNFGGEKRITYTAQGAAVNTASRLESLNKKLGTRLCASGETLERCRQVLSRPIGTVVVRGASEPIDIFEPLHQDQYSEDYLRVYALAFERLRRGQEGAWEFLTALHRERPDDPCVNLHLERLGRGETGVMVSSVT